MLVFIPPLTMEIDTSENYPLATMCKKPKQQFTFICAVIGAFLKLGAYFCNTCFMGGYREGARGAQALSSFEFTKVTQPLFYIANDSNEADVDV